MGFYDEMQEVVSDVMAEFAQGEILLEHRTPGGRDPDKPHLTLPDTTVTLRVDGTVRRVRREYVDGTLIVGTEQQITLGVMGTPVSGGSPVLLSPETGDVFLVDGVRRPVKSVIRIPDAGTPVAFAAILES